MGSTLKTNVFESVVGFLVLCCVGWFAWYASSFFRDEAVGSGYTVYANFDNVSGVNIGSDVRVAGVKVGIVQGWDLDKSSYEVKLAMMLQSDIQLPVDSSVHISSDGLFGDSYVSISPGGEESMLGENEVFSYTQGRIDILSVLSKAFMSK